MKKLIDVTEADVEKLAYFKNKDSERWECGILLGFGIGEAVALARDNHAFAIMPFEMAKKHKEDETIDDLQDRLFFLAYGDRNILATPDEIIEV